MQGHPKVTCIDDVPSAAHLAARQRFFKRWYRPIALAPFALIVFVAIKFFSNSTSKLIDALIFLSLAWALAVAAYTFYLVFFSLKCPACASRFGIGDKCRTCGLPRHGDLDPIPHA